MCGIIYQRGGNASESILNQYKRQQGRGSDGFGFVLVGETVKRQRYTTEAETFYNLAKTGADEIIFHHRYPTSTANITKQNHPIFTSQYKRNYFLVHNGIISNANELYEKHTKQGKKYETEAERVRVEAGITQKVLEFNDSECLLHELAMYLEGEKKSIDTIGSIAFILLQTDKNGNPLRLYYGRNEGNPLKIVQQKDIVKISSEQKGGNDLPANVIHFYDYRSKTEKTIKEPIGQYFTTHFSGIWSDDYIPFAEQRENDIDTLIWDMTDRAYELYENFDIAGLDSLAKDAERLLDTHKKELNQSQKDAIMGFVADVGEYTHELERIEQTI